MDVVKLPKKYRDLCAAIRQGEEPDPKLLDAFREKFPHQAAAVEAELAAFRMDWAGVMDRELAILPFLREWYYSNVPAQQMTLLCFAARRLGREEEAKAALIKERESLLAELPEADRRSPYYAFAGYMLEYLGTGIMPYDEELHYREPEEPKGIEELRADLRPKERDTDAGRQKLLNLCCLQGTAADALGLYEELADRVLLTEMWHLNAIQRYLYLGAEGPAVRAAERWAASRLWMSAAPTQVRPVVFFQHPILHPFLSDADILCRLEEAACRGSVLTTDFCDGFSK